MRARIYLLPAILPAMLLAASCTSGGTYSGRIDVRPAQPAETAAPETAYSLGKRQLALGNLGLAIDAFRKAVREEPESADALNGLAVAYDRIGRFDLSRQAYEQALALAPDDRAIRHNLQTSLIRQGLHEQATRLAAETGAAPPVVVAQAAPATSPAPRPRANAGEMRLERLSLREVALVTTPARNGWEAVARGDSSAPTAATGLAAKARPYAVSKNGAVELALAPAARPYAESKRGKLEVALAPAASKGPAVMVLNAVGKRGLARRMSGYLRERGWDRTMIGDARIRPAHSILVHAPGDRLSALLLARSLPFRPRLVVSGKARSVTLLLGRNAAEFDQSRRVSSS